jgi:hypothetical protein
LVCQHSKFRQAGGKKRVATKKTIVVRFASRLREVWLNARFFKKVD